MAKNDFLDTEGGLGCIIRATDVTGLTFHRGHRKDSCGVGPLRQPKRKEFWLLALAKTFSNFFLCTKFKIKWGFDSFHSNWKEAEVLFHRRSGKPFGVTFKSNAQAERYFKRKHAELEYGPKNSAL